MSRIDAIRARATAAGAGAALLTHPAALRWAVGFTGSNGLLAVTDDAAHFVTDGRYTEQAGAEVRGAEVHIAPGPLVTHVARRGLLTGTRRVVVASEHTTLAASARLGDELADVEVVPVEEFLAEAVASKTEEEIDAVRRAQALTCRVFEAVVPQIAAGVTEQEMAAEIVCQHLRRGAAAMSFEPIVAAGPRGALPHARPSSRPIERGDLVVIDMGCVLDGFCSDLTRTVAVGEPPGRARDAYETVRRAQRAAVAAARAGMSGKALDQVARSVIEADGLGEHFSHSLGHGVGTEVHEWPRLSQQVEHRLPEGATVTIEPGVYVPGAFGVRIEDVVVLREDGCDNLTPLPTDLVVVG